MLEWYSTCPACHRKIIFYPDEAGYHMSQGTCPWCNANLEVHYEEECDEDYSDCWDIYYVDLAPRDEDLKIITIVKD